MATVLALGALALSGFNFYLSNKTNQKVDYLEQELRYYKKELREHKADIQAKVNLNFGKGKS